jgi:hypothetical protein
MSFVLASGWLAPLGQVAAIILALYLFVSIIVGLVLTIALMFGFAWLREKAELIRSLRPFVKDFNRALEASKRGDPLPQEVAGNKIIQAAAQVSRVAVGLPGTASNIEQRVEHGSGRVASAVIEFSARTAMVKGVARALFLPGSVRSRRKIAIEQRTELEPEQVAAIPEEVREPLYEEEMIIIQSAR